MSVHVDDMAVLRESADFAERFGQYGTPIVYDPELHRSPCSNSNGLEPTMLIFRADEGVPNSPSWAEKLAGMYFGFEFVHWQNDARQLHLEGFMMFPAHRDEFVAPTLDKHMLIWFDETRDIMNVDDSTETEHPHYQEIVKLKIAMCNTLARVNVGVGYDD